MSEHNLVHWLVTVALPIGLAIATFYTASKGRAEMLERRLTKMEVLNEMQDKILDSHDLRLNKHEEEQKIILGLVEQIRSLTDDIGEFRSELKDIKKTFFERKQN